MLHSAITNSIMVEVIPRFEDIPVHGDRGKYVFSYTVKITNLGANKQQLISRKWIISNAVSEKKTVEGAGVVGEQPVIQPGQTYIYSSVCPLNTEFGRMHGHYVFHCWDTDEHFIVNIPSFLLEATYKLN